MVDDYAEDREELDRYYLVSVSDSLQIIVYAVIATVIVMAIPLFVGSL